MAAYQWRTGVSGAWDTATNWTNGVVPNAADADVTIDAASIPAPGYNVTIAAGTSKTVRSLDLASSNQGVVLDGTLSFAPGSSGVLGHEFQSSPLVMHDGTLVNAGLMYTFIQTYGNARFIGANPIYIAWQLQVVEGTATVDTASIAQYSAATRTLFDGAFEALGAGRVINLGGSDGGLVVNIETMTGPKSTPTTSYWTQLTYDDPGSQINEWNGTAYVPVESTLKRIDNAAYVTVTNGRGYTTSNTLTIGQSGVFEAAGGVVSTGGLTVENGGLFIGGLTSTGSSPSTGQVTVQGTVNNNGLVIAEGPGLVLRDALSGTGQVSFHRTGILPAFDTPVVPATPTTLEVGAVGAGQTFLMNGKDTLILDAPARFAGTVANFDASDTLLVKAGVTSASYAASGNGVGVLTLRGDAVVGTVALAGNYTGDSFTVTPSGDGATISLSGAMSFGQPTVQMSFINGPTAGGPVLDPALLTPPSPVVGPGVSFAALPTSPTPDLAASQLILAPTTTDLLPMPS